MGEWLIALIKGVCSFFLKVIAIVCTVAIMIAASYQICFHLSPASYIQPNLDMDALFQNVIGFLPFVGEIAGIVFSAIGIAIKPVAVVEITMLAEITFSMLLSAVFQIMAGIYSIWKHLIERILPVGKPEAVSADLICFFIVILSSIAISSMYGDLFSSILTDAGYAPWAVILGVVLLVITFLAVKFQGTVSLSSKLLRILANAVIVMLVYLVAISGYCLSYSEYLIGPELIAIYTCFFLSVLTLTLLGSWFFADSFAK